MIVGRRFPFCGPTVDALTLAVRPGAAAPVFTCTAHTAVRRCCLFADSLTHSLACARSLTHSLTHSLTRVCGKPRAARVNLTVPLLHRALTPRTLLSIPSTRQLSLSILPLLIPLQPSVTDSLTHSLARSFGVCGSPLTARASRTVPPSASPRATRSQRSPPLATSQPLSSAADPPPAAVPKPQDVVWSARQHARSQQQQQQHRRAHKAGAHVLELLRARRDRPTGHLPAGVRASAASASASCHRGGDCDCTVNVPQVLLGVAASAGGLLCHLAEY
jgi:hypothetical protein